MALELTSEELVGVTYLETTRQGGLEQSWAEALPQRKHDKWHRTVLRNPVVHGMNEHMGYNMLVLIVTKMDQDGDMEQACFIS